MHGDPGHGCPSLVGPTRARTASRNRFKPIIAPFFKWGDGLITFKLFEESIESHFHAGATIPFVADLWEDGINVEEIWAHDASCGAPHANRASHFRTSCDEIPARFQRDELGPILAGYRLDENNPIGGCGGDAVS